MKRFLLDTGIAGHFMHRRLGVWERAHVEIARGNRVGIVLPVLAELRFGIEYSGAMPRNFQRLRSAVGRWILWPFDAAAAEEYGRLAAHLKRVGRPMQQNDIQIASIALVLGATVVTTDSDLSAVPGLNVENWAAAASPPASPTS